MTCANWLDVISAGWPLVVAYACGSIGQVLIDLWLAHRRDQRSRLDDTKSIVHVGLATMPPGSRHAVWSIRQHFIDAQLACHRGALATRAVQIREAVASARAFIGAAETESLTEAARDEPAKVATIKESS